jgi:hypothetical protein
MLPRIVNARRAGDIPIAGRWCNFTAEDPYGSLEARGFSSDATFHAPAERKRPSGPATPVAVADERSSSPHAVCR